MAVSSARSNIVSLKERGHFEHKNENERINKYTLSDELPTRLSGLCIESTMKPGFVLRRLTTKDKDKTIDFLKRFFFHDEPMNQAVKLLETQDSRCVELEEYGSSSLSEGISVAAVDDNGEFVGVILNGVNRKEDPTEDKTDSCQNQKFRRILKVLHHLDREAKIWEKLPPTCDKVVEIRIVSTHSDWRGRGLMKSLCKESERIAKSIGAGAMRCDTTSAFSAAAVERLGYQQVYSVRYADLDFAPQPDPPHLEARVYLKEL